MKSIFKDSLFNGIISLQLVVAIFVYGQSWGDSLTFSSLGDLWAGARIEAGHPFPQLAVYDRKGARQNLIHAQDKASTIILKSTCSCDEIQISGWLKEARQKGEAVTLIVPFDEKEEKRIVARNDWQDRILRVRRAELERLGLLKVKGAKKLPLMAHLDANGMIFEVQSS